MRLSKINTALLGLTMVAGSVLAQTTGDAQQGLTDVKPCVAKMPQWHQSTNPRNVTKVIKTYEEYINNNTQGRFVVDYFGIWATDEIKAMNEVVPVDRRKATTEIRRLEECGRNLIGE